MASDGSQAVEWHGQAFPYLMHKPQPAVAVTRAGAVSAETSSTAKGVWDGPAPRGAATRAQAERTQAAYTTEALPQEDHVCLPGGAKLPLLGFGTYKVTSSDVLREALAAGYRHFDCASVYGNEATVGEGLQEYTASRRDELFVTSKVWNDAHRPEAVKASCHKSIVDLRCAYLDLYLIHWPVAWVPGSDNEPDTEVTLQQTWQALEELVDEGLVRHIGVSNFSLAQVEALVAGARIKPVVNQVELHPLLAQRKLVGGCLRKGVKCVAYSPLGHSAPVLLTHPEVVAIAEETGKTPAQVALKWNVQRGVPVIPRSQTPKNIKSNIEGMFDWQLSPAQKARLDALDSNTRTVKPITDQFDWNCATL
ncbi:hypothetical protein WJX72_003232 [[Myrmecia] bisecta]|uniref:NADP-dependent oxidoreductase domain-containing protein n=1 Tax=[Myrmecia] bisecta TaxID=41462 RepID=A0AAW1PCW9_9CHLO